MPGRIVRVLVAVGDRVTARQPVVVVEAMKMENELRAPRDGVVKEVSVHAGAAVETGAVARRRRSGSTVVVPLTVQALRAHSIALRVPLHAAGGRRAGDAARRGDRGDADDRPRPGPARARRARRLEAHRAADAHRQARRAPLQRQVRARRLRHRRARRHRSPVPRRRSASTCRSPGTRCSAAKCCSTRSRCPTGRWCSSSGRAARHSFPKFNTGGGSGPRRFVTTMQYVRTRNGEVTFEDHGTPWSAVARNLDITVTKFAAIAERRRFHGGTIKIQNYVPMSASMKAVFRVDGGIVHFERMDLTDRRRRVDHHRRRRHRALAGADLPGEIGRRLQAHARAVLCERDLHPVGRGALRRRVSSLQRRTVADRRFRERRGRPPHRRPRLPSFPTCKGKLAGCPNRFDVTDTTTGFYGGTARLKYSIAPLGRPQPATRAFDAEWQDVDLASYSDFLADGGRAPRRQMERPQPARLAARPVPRARGRRLLRGGSAGRRAGAVRRPRERSASGPEQGGAHPPIGHLPIAGQVTYRYDRDWLEFSDGRFSTPATDVTFSGAHGLGRRLAHSVSCDERRPAGERSRAGRHDDGVRRADQCRSRSAARPSSRAS